MDIVTQIMNIGGGAYEGFIDRVDSFTDFLNLLKKALFPKLLIIGYIPPDRLESEKVNFVRAKRVDHYIRAIELTHSAMKPQPYFPKIKQVHIDTSDPKSWGRFIIEIVRRIHQTLFHRRLLNSRSVRLCRTLRRPASVRRRRTQRALPEGQCATRPQVENMSRSAVVFIKRIATDGTDFTDESLSVASVRSVAKTNPRSEAFEQGRGPIGLQIQHGVPTDLLKNPRFTPMKDTCLHSALLVEFLRPSSPVLTAIFLFAPATAPLFASGGRSAEADALYESSLKQDDVQAIRTLLRAQKSAPRDERISYRIGFLFHKMNRRPEAREAYERTIAIDGCHVRALNNVGNILKDQGLQDEGGRELRESHRMRSRLYGRTLQSGESNAQAEALSAGD